VRAFLFFLFVAIEPPAPLIRLFYQVEIRCHQILLIEKLTAADPATL
jgi:hypothetical protein